MIDKKIFGKEAIASMERFKKRVDQLKYDFGYSGDGIRRVKRRLILLEKIKKSMCGECHTII
jgi:hypothetical protein